MEQWTAPVALVGSGEYLPSMLDIERSLLEGRPARYVQLATAAVPDGPDTLAKWHRLGAEQAQRLGVEQIVLPVETRDDAFNDDIAAMVRGAGLIYLSGGNPSFLAEVLRESPLWGAILAEFRSGAALAGCSAGAMVMAKWVPTLRHPRGGGTSGLSLTPHLRVIPHFDAFIARLPDLVTRLLVDKEPGVTLIGVDEETALVGGPTRFEVRGRGSAWMIGHEGREEFPSGSVVEVSA
ncbi:MAG: Type 1 glutamine amidotransferase-like domain-containing protein [Acidobacteria bacterium]|nr:Type 1 glutamine amidotransferase-like domain-containing protein [Acidobacteriota bacterium]